MAKKIGETVAHRIYGPYQTGTKIVWWVIPAHGKKRVFKSKLKMLEFIDTITTDLLKKKEIIRL